VLTTSQITLMSRLLDEALPLDEAGRRLWLEKLPPEYGELATALHSALLPATSESGHSIELMTQPKFESRDEAALRAASSLQEGARVGPYELIRSLGSGGMAQVWLARRADGAFKREVALKLPMLRRLRTDLEERFVRERDILASLEHPQIARFYDAGIDPNGLPYFAMEYVRGEPITASGCASAWHWCCRCWTRCSMRTRTTSSTATSSPPTSS
jgi:eukaryotic-like serine/threonine-protein kinase